jgi:hypothetical protein
MVETVCAILKKLMREGKIFHRLEIELFVGRELHLVSEF